MYRMISVTCPEALTRLSAMVLYKIQLRDYPTPEGMFPLP